MPRGQKHSDETRAKVLADLALGKSAAQIARERGIDKALIGRWKKAAELQGLQPVATLKKSESENGSPDAQSDLGQLVAKYLESSLNALAAQMKVAADETYIRKQPASELAVLHGVIADKGFRLLEAAYRHQLTLAQSESARDE